MRSFHKALALSILFSSTPAPAQFIAGRWLPSGHSDDARFYVDRLTLERRGNLVSVWTQASYERPKPTGEIYSMSHLEIDCAARTSDLISVTDYRPDGSVVSRIVLEPSERRPAPVGTGSIAGTMLSIACR